MGFKQSLCHKIINTEKKYFLKKKFVKKNLGSKKFGAVKNGVLQKNLGPEIGVIKNYNWNG